MYHAAASTGSAATLAFTGTNDLWLLSAACTMLFAGLAIKALLPRRRASK